MKSPRERVRRLRRNWLRLAVAVAVTVAAWMYFEPLQPRLEGRTVKQWIIYNADERALPKRDVVQYFGAGAVPVLVRESQPSGLFSASIALEKVFTSRRFDAMRSADFDRRMACADWAQMLLSLDATVFARVLAQTSDDEEALSIARLFYGERYVGQTLEALSRQETNRTLQARAGVLLQKYRDAI